MPYTLEAGRTIVGPSGLRLVALQRLQIPESEHPDGCTGAYTIQATEADRFAHQIVDALNAEESPHASALACGVMLARRVLNNWESGDLAGAVNALREWADDVESDFPDLDYSDEMDESGPTFCVGYNTPGYMPEGEPEGDYESWSEAVEAVAAIVSEDARHYEEEDGADVAAIQAEEAAAIVALSADPSPRDMREGIDVVFRGRAYFIRPNDESAS